MTSIGLDGEEIDQVTFMDKPRIFVRPGYIVATAEDTLDAFEADYEVKLKTTISTAIGDIVIVKIKTSGNALIAGPSVISDMAKVTDLMAQFGLSRIFIDGAFFRQSIARVSQATILVIGANLNQSIDQVVDDALLIKRKLTLKRPPVEFDFSLCDQQICFINSSDDYKKTNLDSLIGQTENLLVEENKSYRFLYLPKAMTNDFVRRLIQERRSYHWGIIMDSPLSIQLNSANLSHLFKLKNQLYVLNEVNLIAICYNPISPQGYAFSDKSFKEKLEKDLELEVINVLGGSTT